MLGTEFAVWYTLPRQVGPTVRAKTIVRRNPASRATSVSAAISVAGSPLAAIGQRVTSPILPGATDPVSGQPALKMGRAEVRRHAAAWYGFAVSRARPLPATDYWAVAPTPFGFRTELADAVARSAGLAAKELKGDKKLNLRVHGRTGQPYDVCGTTIAEVSFADSSLQYCPGCQTGGKPLADRRMSRLLK